MRTRIRRAYPFAAIILAVIVQGALPLSGVFAGKKSHTLSSATEDGLAADGQSSEAARLNSIGVAYMNQQRFADAQKQFESALKSQPDYLLAKLNLGISLLSQQKSEDARKALQEAAEKLPGDPYAWYNLGLVYKDISEQEKAIEAFQHVTEIAPTEPDAFYFIGYLNTQLQRYDAAIAAFQSALAVFPFHASAEFGLARAYQRKGDADNAREHLQKFQKITSQHLGTPFGAGYGDQGKFSLAEYSKSGLLKAPAAIPVKYAPQSIAAGPSSGACFFDYDGDGKPDLLLVRAAENGSPRLLHNGGDGKFEDKTVGSGLSVTGSGLGCAAGDYDNDGKTDFAICMGDGVHLFHNDGGGKFTDVTKAVNIRSEKGCSVVTFVDFDHDGDLDLYISAKPGAGAHNVVWRNNGNSTFSDVSAETALGKEATGAGVVASDFNNDRAIDFVLAGGAKGASILLNPREGEFKPLDGIDFSKQGLPPAIGVVAFDFDKDGWMEIDLKALNDNKSAIGTKIEIYAGSLYQKWEVMGASGYLGQSVLPIHVGLGSEKGTDVVRLLWPTGVPQDEIRLDGRKTQAVAELDRRGSSCPVLFSWNGHEYEFIADMIGPGVVGHWIAPGERDVPDPTEYLKVSGKSLQPRDGKLSFRFLEPMEETVYLDQVKLLAIDHPARFDVYPNERFAANPPFPEFGVVPSSNANTPKAD